MMPIKTNFALVSYGYSQGNILIDKSLPIEGLDASINSVTLGFARSFKLFKSLATFDVALPYAIGNWQGLVEDIDTSTNRNGIGDPLAHLSFILINGPALNPSEFAPYTLKKFRLGVQLGLRIPLGQYDSSKLINLGANRWAIKGGVGASYRINRFVLESHIDTWFFSTNKDFFGGNTVRQRPIFSGQFNTSYIFKKGLWLSASIGGSTSGEISLNGERFKNTQNNTRFGLVFALPISKRSGFKFVYTNGLLVRYGTDFDTFLLIYQFRWFDKPN